LDGSHEIGHNFGLLRPDSRTDSCDVHGDDGRAVREGYLLSFYLLLEKMAAGESFEQLLAAYRNS